MKCIPTLDRSIAILAVAGLAMTAEIGRAHV